MKMREVWLTAALLFAPMLGWGAPATALVTILDGPALLIREASRFGLAEGVRLGADDIVETDAKARLLRMEFADGLIVDLGPQTRLLIAPRHSGDRARLAARFHVLQGWVKVSGASAAFSAAPFDVESITRSAVFRIDGSDAGAFAEGGELRLRERPAGKPAATPTTIAPQQFASIVGGAKAQVLPRPTPAFLQSVPRPFIDTLPSRAALMQDRAPVAKPLGEIAYADVQAWLAADGLRAGFVTRWKALAKQVEFRKGLVANLRAHPEWDRTLFPEKYLPRPASGPRPATPSYPR